MMLAPGCLYRKTRTAGLPLAKSLVPYILDRVLDFGNIGQAHRRPITIGNHQGTVIGGVVRLIVGVDLEAPVTLFDHALGTVRVGRGERRAHVFEADPVFEQRQWIELDPHGRQRAAADHHLPDAFDLRQRLLHDRRGRIINLPARQRRRGHRQDHDRCVGRVDFAVGRVLAQAGRQIGAGGVDCCLDIARGAVDVPVEIELQGDACRVDGARRGHLADIGDDAEMAFERRRHSCCHRIGAAARHRRKNGDGRKIDLRQWRHRQLRESEESGQRDADRQQSRRNRPLDERRSRVHRSALSGAALPPLVLRRTHSPSRSKPR